MRDFQFMEGTKLGSENLYLKHDLIKNNCAFYQYLILIPLGFSISCSAGERKRGKQNDRPFYDLLGLF